MKTKKTNILWGEIKATLKLAIPLITALLSQIAMEFVDTLMLGRLGPNALAAGGLGSAFFITLFVLCLGIMIAIGTCVAHAYGGKQYYEVSHLGRQGMWLVLFLAIPCMLILWFTPQILTLLKHNRDVVNNTSLYIHGLLWAFLPALGFLTLREFISALSRPQMVMIITFIAIPLNALCNYILMYGKWGFPNLGVQGIGIATSFVQTLMLVALILFVHNSRHFRHYNLFRYFEWPDFKKIFELLHVGLPVGITLLLEVGLFSLTAILMASLGTSSMAAHQIAIQTMSIVYMIPLGIAEATTMRVGQTMGAHDPKRAYLITHISLGLGLLCGGITALCLWLFPKAIIGLFVDLQDPNNAVVIGYAVQFLKIAAVFVLVDVVQSVANGALRGIKDTYIPMLLGLISYWGSGLLSGYVLAFVFDLGGVGLWWGLAIGIAASALCLYGRFHYKIKQKIANHIIDE